MINRRNKMMERMAERRGRHIERFGEHAGHFFGPGGRGFGPGGPFGGRGGPFGRPGRPGDDDAYEGRRRQRRGDIKYALLELLAEQPRHGYDLIKELEQRYGGFYRPSPGSVYPTLQMLEDEEYLTSEQSTGKRIYTITDAGREFLNAHQQAQQRAEQRGGMGRHRPELHELRQSGEALLTSTMQVARHGTPEQVKAVQSLLDSTRREVYRILSESPQSEE